MNERELTKLVQLYTTSPVSDGVGGWTTGNVLLAECWAKVETVKSNQAKSIDGLNFSQNNLIITLRYRDDIDYTSSIMYLTYRGAKYTIVNYPDNVNFRDAFIVIYATENK